MAPHAGWGSMPASPGILLEGAGCGCVGVVDVPHERDMREPRETEGHLGKLVRSQGASIPP